MRRASPFVLCLILSSFALAAEVPSEVTAMLATPAIAKYNPKLVETFTPPTDELKKKTFSLSRITYEEKGAGPRPGFVLWTDAGGKATLLWSRLYQESDVFGPHTVRWIDMNGDGRHDLVLFGGYQEARWSEIYVNQMNAPVFSEGNFEWALSNATQFTIPLDLDGDGTPEILDWDERNNPSPCSDLRLPGNVEDAMLTAYVEASKPFAQKNSASSGNGILIGSLALLEPVRILKMKRNAKKFTDETRTFKKHLRFRVQMLREIIKDPRKIAFETGKSRDAGSACRREIQSLIAHLNGKPRSEAARTPRRGRRP